MNRSSTLGPSAASSPGGPSLPDSSATPRTVAVVGRFRWVICALLLLGTTKNYMDRQVLGVLKNTLQHDLGWNEIDYGNLVFAFQAAYALALLLVGRVVDRLGTRRAYSVIIVFWSLASMAHAFARSLADFVVARFALGLGEGGVFPVSIKAVAEWFPRRERALATGFFNAGTSMGAILTPLIVPWITLHFGWRAAFLMTGALGFGWLIFWIAIYRRPEDHPRCSEAELAYITSDPPETLEKVTWLSLVRYRQAWAFILGKFLTDPIWWFYLFWVPDFLQREHGLPLIEIGLPLVVIYLISDAGSVVGGWISSALLKRGASVNAARKTAMLICAVSVTPIALAYRVAGLWTAVLLIGLATAAHQGFSANIYTLSSDMFPKRAVGSVVGVGGMAGAIGGMFIAKIVGHVLQWTGSYRIPFLMAASAYLVAVAAIHILAPRLEPVAVGAAHPKTAMSTTATPEAKS